MGELSLRWLALMVDVSLKAVLLAGVTGVLLTVARIRHSSWRHAAWLAVLVALIGLPLLAPVIPALPIPWPVSVSTPTEIPVAIPASVPPIELMDAAPMAEIWRTSSPFMSLIDGEVPAADLIQKVATSNADGKFAFRSKPLPASAPHNLDWSHTVWLVARAPGYGFDWLPAPVFEEHPRSTESRVLLQQRIEEKLGAGRFAARSLILPKETEPVRAG